MIVKISVSRYEKEIRDLYVQDRCGSHHIYIYNISCCMNRSTIPHNSKTCPTPEMWLYPLVEIYTKFNLSSIKNV